MNKGYIHSIETFGSVDGPGVRYIIFLQGCKMRCKYCHNPETWATGCGEEKTAVEALSAAMRYKNYWRNNGGITVSGGEPLLQIEFVTELFKLAKEKGVSTVIDTSGEPFTMEEPFISKFDELMKYTDLFLVDIKHIDSGKHRQLTGHSNENILKMAAYLSEKGSKMWIRHVLVPGYTDDEKDLGNLGKFIKSLNTVERFEILPYHTLGLFKWDKLGINYSLKEVKPPTKEEIDRAKKLIGIDM